MKHRRLFGRRCFTWKPVETWKAGISRVCVKASPAFGRRRFHTNTDYIDCTTCDVLDETVVGWKCHWMKILLDEKFIGWNCCSMKVFWMKVSLDESVKIGWKCFGRKCHWMNPFLDESVIGWNRVWMKVCSTDRNCYFEERNSCFGEKLFLFRKNVSEEKIFFGRKIFFKRKKFCRHFFLKQFFVKKNSVFWEKNLPKKIFFWR